MAVINFANREISCKIVYFGAPGAGCNTNVRHLHASLEAHAGALHRFEPPDSPETTWFFTYDPPADPIQGFHIRYRVYSLPGGISDAAHRNEVLREVDGVIFVADARDASLPGNEAALLDLEAALADQGIELAGLPVVLQVNHTDAESSADLGSVTRPLNAYGFPVQRCAAKSGIGVREAFEASLRATRVGLSDTFSGTTRSIVLRAQHRSEGHEAPLRSLLEVAPSVPSVAVQPTEYLKPEEEIELPFQPKEFAGTHPVRILDTTIEDGQVIVDLELQRMGGGATRGLRVRLANRPTDQPAAPSTAVHSLSPVVAAPLSPIIGITDHLPDKIEFNMHHESQGMPPLWYGVAGLLGGVLGGVLIGFLIFH